MFGHEDLETGQGTVEFEECCKSVERFIRSKSPPCDVDDLVQETIGRVLEKLEENPDLKVNAGYFINTAKYVLLECYRKHKDYLDRYKNISTDGTDEEDNRPLDSEPQYKDYLGNRERVVLNECYLECFNERTEEEQLLLYNYVYKEKYLLYIEESETSDNPDKNFLKNIISIAQKLLPLQDKKQTLKKNATIRTKVRRIREKLNDCLKDCMSEKI